MGSEGGEYREPSVLPPPLNLTSPTWSPFAYGLGHPDRVGASTLLALAAGNRVVRPRARAMARRVTLGAGVVRSLAAVAGSEVRIGESRGGCDRERRGRQKACH